MIIIFTIQMGCCCNRNLLVQLPNRTKLFYQCPQKAKQKAKVICIRLENDVYIIEPAKNDLIETSDVDKYDDQNGTLTLLVGDEGIKTRDSRIKQSFEQILNRTADKYSTIVFEEPKFNYQNKEKIFKLLLKAIILYDIQRDNRVLRNVYVPWEDLSVPHMLTLYEIEKLGLEVLRD